MMRWLKGYIYQAAYLVAEFPQPFFRDWFFGFAAAKHFLYIFAEHIKLDFFGHPPYPGIFKPLREKESEKKAEEAKGIPPTEKPKIPELTMPPDVIDPLSFIREIETKPAIQ